MAGVRGWIRTAELQGSFIECILAAMKRSTGYSQKGDYHVMGWLYGTLRTYVAVWRSISLHIPLLGMTL